jgi:hypothetical protein
VTPRLLGTYTVAVIDGRAMVSSSTRLRDSDTVEQRIAAQIDDVRRARGGHLELPLSIVYAEEGPA